MGAVLTPGLFGMEDASDLPNASTLCGKCESVCPMRIPLPNLLRSWRTRYFELKPARSFGQYTLSAWAWLAKKPKLYHTICGLFMAMLGSLGRKNGRLRWLPFASGWTLKRDFPTPMGDTFIQQYHGGARGDASGQWLREIKNE
jgi:L-lactate dehydrogenase complex protein LldF